MAYTNDSIKKAVRLMTATKALLESSDISTIKMCISKGNRKIGRVMNVSLPPILSCHNCSECKHFCYDIKACLQYPNTVIDARVRNYVILLNDRNRYFDEIDKAIARRRVNKFFRWHVAGDIVDYDYFDRMIQIARNHSDFVFWTYTKVYGIVNEWIAKNGSIPSNFHIMFSEWDGMAMDNPYNMPIFSCKLKNGNKNRTAESFAKMHRCPGNCDICKASGHGCVVGESSYADEH